MGVPSRMPAFGAEAAHYHKPLLLHGQTYELSHLDPFVFEAVSAKVPRPLRINVRFTNHCFSERFDADRHPADAPIMMDGTRQRAFSRTRYELSRRLPGVIRGLGTSGAYVQQTAARRNWMYAAIIDEPMAGTRFQVFFEMRRTVTERRALQDLDMMVESAYPADPGRALPNVLGRVRFVLLAGSTFLGQRIATRR